MSAISYLFGQNLQMRYPIGFFIFSSFLSSCSAMNVALAVKKLRLLEVLDALYSMVALRGQTKLATQNETYRN